MLQVTSFYAETFSISLELTDDYCVFGTFAKRGDQSPRYDCKGLYTQEGDVVNLAFIVDWDKEGNGPLSFTSFSGKIVSIGKIQTLELQWLLVHTDQDGCQECCASKNPVLLTSELTFVKTHDYHPFPFQ
jgi:hypothetical protein